MAEQVETAVDSVWERLRLLRRRVRASLSQYAAEYRGLQARGVLLEGEMRVLERELGPLVGELAMPTVVQCVVDECMTAVAERAVVPPALLVEWAADLERAGMASTDPVARDALLARADQVRGFGPPNPDAVIRVNRAPGTEATALQARLLDSAQLSVLDPWVRSLLLQAAEAVRTGVLPDRAMRERAVAAYRGCADEMGLVCAPGVEDAAIALVGAALDAALNPVGQMPDLGLATVIEAGCA